VEKKRALQLLKPQRKLSFKMFNSHGHTKLTNKKKEVFLQILIAKINCFNWMVYLLGKMEVHSLILKYLINSLVGIAIKYINLIMKTNHFNMAIRYVKFLYF
jgi:hypothetical protein